MKNVAPLLSKSTILLFFTLFIIAPKIKAQCPPDVTISLNGEGSSITIFPGTTITFTGDYELSNPTNCASCLQQLYIGIENNGIECLYSGLPSVCPSSTSGTINFSYPAPSTPGTYNIYSNNPFNFSCDLNDYDGSNGNNAELLGTITVTECDPVVNIYLDGGSNTASVSPGATVAIAGNLDIGNPTSCSGCTQQVIIGVENDVIDCMYSGTPLTCPYFNTETFSGYFNAPTTPGNYNIYSNRYFNTNCNLNDYAGASGNDATIIGSLTVTGCEPEMTLSLDGGGSTITVPAGTTISATGSFELSNPADCPLCIQQVIIGVENNAVECLYSGTPDPCPARSTISYNTTLTAPSSQGVYFIYANNPFNFSCDLNDYAGVLGDRPISLGTIIVDNSSSINELSNISQLVIAPNPTSERINIQTQLQQSSEVTILVYNLTGQVLYTQTTLANQGVYSKTIYASNFSAGVYFCEIKSGNSSVIEKVILQ